MAPVRRHWGMVAAAALLLLVVGSAWASAADPAAEPRAGIDADTVDGHHAGPSNGVKADRANRVLWATPQGKIGAVSLPWSIIDKHYLGTEGDTFHFVPGAELRFHMDDVSRGTTLINNTGQAIVRNTTGGPVTNRVVIPVNLPGMQSGSYVRIVDYRLYYRVDNTADRIDSSWLLKMDASTGGHITLHTDGTDRQSAGWSSYVNTCTVADCQLSWPSAGFVTIVLDLVYTGTGDPHDITIGGVLLRVSYD
ncbi:MAG: hypothetical protein JW785_04235 [Acidimicrobiia bacterium]|nr:hypothetical protein [Acidimicrobiia bacterium]